MNSEAICVCGHVHETLTIDGNTSVFHRCRAKGCGCNEFRLPLPSQPAAPSKCRCGHARALHGDRDGDRECVGVCDDVTCICHRDGEMHQCSCTAYDPVPSKADADLRRVVTLLREGMVGDGTTLSADQCFDLDYAIGELSALRSRPAAPSQPEEGTATVAKSEKIVDLMEALKASLRLTTSTEEPDR